MLEWSSQKHLRTKAIVKGAISLTWTLEGCSRRSPDVVCICRWRISHSFPIWVASNTINQRILQKNTAWVFWVHFFSGTHNTCKQNDDLILLERFLAPDQPFQRRCRTLDEDTTKYSVNMVEMSLRFVNTTFFQDYTYSDACSVSSKQTHQTSTAMSRKFRPEGDSQHRRKPQVSEVRSSVDVCDNSAWLAWQMRLRILHSSYTHVPYFLPNSHYFALRFPINFWSNVNSREEHSGFLFWDEKHQPAYAGRSIHDAN